MIYSGLASATVRATHDFRRATAREQVKGTTVGFVNSDVLGLVFSLVVLILGMLFRNRVGETPTKTAISRFSLIRQTVFDAVLHVEQVFSTGATGGYSDKREMAIDTVTSALRAFGIEPSAAEIETIASFIETAVRDLTLHGAMGPLPKYQLLDPLEATPGQTLNA